MSQAETWCWNTPEKQQYNDVPHSSLQPQNWSWLLFQRGTEEDPQIQACWICSSKTIFEKKKKKKEFHIYSDLYGTSHATYV